MGEAKRKRMAAQGKNQELTVAVEKVGSALRRLATAASTNLGSDCYLHAALGRALLADFGFEARITAGEAAWRVGPNYCDVIGHTPRAHGITPASLPPGALVFAYHAWLEIEGVIIDLTTYQLPRKARELDAADGGHTVVDWKPDALVLPLAQLKSYRHLQQSSHAGDAFYEEDPELVTLMAETYELDEDDLNTARLLMANPEIRVIGLNDVKGAGIQE
jgi:hypothetical protein